MRELTSAERKKLRALAHQLKPLIHIGKSGIAEAQLAALNQVLDSHELVKVKFQNFKEEKTELLELITQSTGCQIAGLIGHIAILYREQADLEKRKIQL
jgi:RNA-binding protein